MTTTVNKLTGLTLSSNGIDSLTTTLGLAVIAVLALLLLTRELVVAMRGGDARRETRALDVAIVPLLVAIAVIVLSRLASLLK